MNILENKSVELQQAFANLQTILGKAAFDVVDHWEGDLCAIGIAHPDNHQLLVYISTYEMAQGEFFVSLELPPKNASETYKSAGEYKNVKLDGLIEIIRRHFSFA